MRHSRQREAWLYKTRGGHVSGKRDYLRETPMDLIPVEDSKKPCLHVTVRKNYPILLFQERAYLFATRCTQVPPDGTRAETGSCGARESLPTGGSRRLN